MGSATYTPETPTLLRTKLHRPRLAADLISRSNLLERLNRGFQRRATLISAPAGFGKTTLASSWLLEIGDWRLDNAQSSQSPITNNQSPKAAWLSLDEGNSHLVGFLGYFIAAIQTLFPDACSTAHSLLTAPPTLPLDCNDHHPRYRRLSNPGRMRTAEGAIAANFELAK
jgi:LuxR family maltose regulon positive regulatory protein